MIRRSVYVRHLIVVGLLMTGMLLLTGRGRVTRDTPGTAPGTVARSDAPGAPKPVPAAMTLSARLPD